MIRSYQKRFVVLLFPFAFFLLYCSANAQAGKSGLAFLKLGVSGRAVSMGDAASANVAGAAATHYNPAGVFSNASGAIEFLLMHKEWIQDVRSQFLGASIRLNDESALGFSVNTATVSDIQIRTRPGISEGTFTSRDFSFGLSYARSFSDELKVGLTAKYLFEKIFLEEANGFAFDIGAQYKTPIDNLSAGLALTNLGSMNVLRSESITLPALLRVGPAYSLALDDFTSQAIIAADLLYILPEKKAYVNIGGELLFSNVVAARVGYQLGSNARGFSAGAGVKYDLFNVDYGFAPLSADLGSGHTFSLTMIF
jgi:hypothetical protein